MEPLRTQLKRGLSRRAFLTGMALASVAPLGCFSRHLVKKSEPMPAPQGRFVSAWQNKVCYAPDVTRGGAVFPGLVTRVYLFGPALDVPYIGDGRLSIAIYDATQRGPNSEPKLTDIVNFDPDTLKQFAKTDFVGPGYTIFCPWFKYQPDVTHVFITMEYTSSSGEKLFHQSGTLSVDHSETKERAKKGMPAYAPDVAPAQ